jgi:hypothetical protein
MTVRLIDESTIVLEGVCTADDAEILLHHLVSASQYCTVDWRLCEHTHTAIIQVLLASQAKLCGLPLNPFLRDWVARSVMTHSVSAMGPQRTDQYRGAS